MFYYFFYYLKLTKHVDLQFCIVQLYCSSVGDLFFVYLLRAAITQVFFSSTILSTKSVSISPSNDHYKTVSISSLSIGLMVRFILQDCQRYLSQNSASDLKVHNSIQVSI